PQRLRRRHDPPCPELPNDPSTTAMSTATAPSALQVTGLRPRCRLVRRPHHTGLPMGPAAVRPQPDPMKGSLGAEPPEPPGKSRQFRLDAFRTAQPRHLGADRAG